jgi:hypothetical protein
MERKFLRNQRHARRGVIAAARKIAGGEMKVEQPVPVKTQTQVPPKTQTPQNKATAKK